MYRWLRDSHLLVGLFFLTFVLMFGVSSIKFAHPGWFSNEPNEVRSTTVAIPEEDPTPRSVARYLMEGGGLRGSLFDIQESEGGFRFRIGRPGATYEVAYNRESKQARIETRTWPLMRILLGMHHGFGLDHDYWVMNLLGAFTFATSLAFLILGGSGLYLWFRLPKQRLPGLILAVGSFLVAAGLILSVRFA